MTDPSLNVWSARIDGLREGRSRGDFDPRDFGPNLFAEGDWHGYKEAADARSGADPMRGEFFLVRWKRPTVAVSHDDPDEAIRLAQLIEEAVGDG